MLPILFLLFFLAQAQILQADEFPYLLKRVDVTWDDWIVTTALNAKQTMSIDGEVPSFIFCGYFKTSAEDRNCSLTYRYEYNPWPYSERKGNGK